MRAAVIKKYAASAEVEEVKASINIEEKWPIPQAGDYDVRVHVHAASINPVDWKMLKGHLSLVLRGLPRSPGLDLSGRVEAVGSKVTRFKVGDLVWGSAHWRQQGSFAEHAIAPEDRLTLKSPALTFAEASCLPVAGLTAWQGLTMYGKLREGEKILILGGSGGTGHLAVQMAKLLRAGQIIATCSEKNVPFVQQMGATKVIDYNKVNWWEELKGAHIDMVYDTVGQAESWERAQDVLTPATGRFVSIVGTRPGGGFGSTVLGFGMGLGRKVKSFFGGNTFMLGNAQMASVPDLDKVNEICGKGEVKVHIEDVMPLAQIQDLYVRAMAGRTVGKLVIAVSNRAQERE